MREARQGAARKGAAKERHVALAVLEEQARQGSALAVPRWHEEELYARIGIGKLALPTVMEEVIPSEDTERDSLRPGFIERTVQRVAGDADGAGIRIQGMDNMLVRFAQCCNPVPGDPVTGWITRGRGVSVHRRGCPRVLELDPERRVQVSWADDVDVDLPVSLRVMTDDRAGILASVSSVFSSNGISISEASCLSKDGRAENMFHFRSATSTASARSCEASRSSRASSTSNGSSRPVRWESNARRWSTRPLRPRWPPAGATS